MIIFTNGWGETATTRNEIVFKNMEHMTEEDYVNELRGIADEIISWALRQADFRYEFEDCIQKAETDWALSQGWWEEEEKN